jgi:hypothetical protein
MEAGHYRRPTSIHWRPEFYIAFDLNLTVSRQPRFIRILFGLSAPSAVPSFPTLTQGPVFHHGNRPAPFRADCFHDITAVGMQSVCTSMCKLLHAGISCFLLLMRQMLIKLSGLFELQQTGLLDF